MDKFAHYLEAKDTEAIENMTQFDLNNLEKLYLIDYCNKLNKCKISFCRKHKEFYKNLKDSIQKKELEKGTKPKNFEIELKNKVNFVKI